MLGLCVACARKPVAPAPAATEVTLVGDMDLRDPAAPRLAWGATQVRASFQGPDLGVTLTDRATDPSHGENDWLSVSIDDASPTKLALREGKHHYMLATHLAPGPHTITLWKRTEPAVGVITFHGFDVVGNARPTPRPAPARTLLAIGDSITAGYGNEGQDPCGWSAARENSQAAYTALAAQALGMGYVAHAWSGKGVTRNFDRREPLTMVELFAREMPTEAPLAPSRPAAQADVVVVNLGTNDFFAGIPDRVAFQSRMALVLDALKKRNPRAWMVLGLGPMILDTPPTPNARTTLRGWLESIMGQYRKRHDDRISLIELWTAPDDGLGCHGHPNLKTNQRLAQELTAHLRERLGP